MSARATARPGAGPSLGTYLGAGIGALRGGWGAWGEPILPASCFALGAWGWGSGILPGLLTIREDIVYLAGQHVAMVLWAGGLAILAGLLLGAILARPRFAAWSEYALQVFNLGTTVPTLAVLAPSMTVLGIGIVPAIFGLWVATLLPNVRAPTPASLRSRRTSWRPGREWA